MLRQEARGAHRFLQLLQNLQCRVTHPLHAIELNALNILSEWQSGEVGIRVGRVNARVSHGEAVFNLSTSALRPSPKRRIVFASETATLVGCGFESGLRLSFAVQTHLVALWFQL